MTIELASPLFPGAFLLLACLGSVARAVTGVAGGATRAALTQHFARQRNAADIAAKEGSQVGREGLEEGGAGRGAIHLSGRIVLVGGHCYLPRGSRAADGLQKQEGSCEGPKLKRWPGVPGRIPLQRLLLPSRLPAC